MKLKHVLWITVYLLAAWLNGCGAEAAFAQKLEAKASPPQFSTAERLALQTLAKDLNQNAQERQQLMATLQAISSDIAAEHPGYHFDMTSGQIEKDAVKPATKEPAQAATKEPARK